MGKLLILVLFLFLIYLAIRIGRFAVRMLVFAASIALLLVALFFVFVR